MVKALHQFELPAFKHFKLYLQFLLYQRKWSGIKHVEKHTHQSIGDSRRADFGKNRWARGAMLWNWASPLVFGASFVIFPKNFELRCDELKLFKQLP
jgi:hypothetical protein